MSYKIIKDLIKYLPKKDIELGNKFYDNKEWDSLRELVESAVYKINVDLRKETPKQESLDANMNKLNELRIEIDLHIIEVDPEEYLDDYDSEIGKIDFDDEYL